MPMPKRRCCSGSRYYAGMLDLVMPLQKVRQPLETLQGQSTLCPPNDLITRSRASSDPECCCSPTDNFAPSKERDRAFGSSPRERLIGFHGLGTLDPAGEGFSLAWDL